MPLLIFGLVLFLGVHSVSIVAPAWRDHQVAVREGAFKGIYSLVSLVGFIALLYGYGMARLNPVVLYSPPAGLRHLALLLMVPVFPLFISTYLPGRISRAVKHPTLLAVKFWATAHLLANGTLHDVVLFGAFLVWAIADRIAVKRRAVPHKIPGAPPSGRNDVIAVVLGLVIYVAFVWRVHLWLIGVSPLG
ncbi:MAG: nnrU [Rhizobacter sp.]|nr:nnrU [Rhizobacter sp.]